MTKAKLESLALSAIVESPKNPRRYFDPKKLGDLVASMKAHGQLTPALVRPVGKKFELAAGHRRFRAAPRAELETLDCIVRDLSDVEFIEILTIENDEREDVHPLEQAAGYKLLMTDAGYDVAKIAARLQRSHDFVYDRLSLLQLIPPLKQHFMEDHFTLGHAVILSKLTADQQRDITHVDEASNGRFNGGESGLWRIDYSLFHDEEEKAGRWPYQPHSVGELQQWVNDHIRFRPEEVQLETQYPETEAMLVAAAEAGAPVYHITSGYNVGRDARDPTQRTYGERSWRRADGLEDSTPCELSGVGLFVDGKERGTAIGVCVRRDTCLVHWGTEVRAAEKRRKDREQANAGDPAAAKRVAQDPAPRDAATIARQEREQDVDEKYAEVLITVAQSTIAKAPAAACGASGSVGRFVLDSLYDGSIDFWRNRDKKKVGTTAVDLVRFLALEVLGRIDESGCSTDELEGILKPLGVNLKEARATAEDLVPPVAVPPAKAGKEKGK